MRVLMVCLGNICRSTMAEGILQKKIDDLDLNWFVDSAGTSGWHNGEGPDSRSVRIVRKHQIDISKQRSRIFTNNDFDQFDLILAMDASNYHDIIQHARS